MTTITIKNGKKLSRTEFEDWNDFFGVLKQDVSDYNDPNFVDTILTDQILKKANASKEQIQTNPESFFEI